MVARSEQETIATIFDEFWDTADPASNYRKSARKRLKVNEARGLGPEGRTEGAIRSLHERFDVSLCAEKLDSLPEAQVRGQRAQIVQLWTTADNPELDVLRELCQS